MTDDPLWKAIRAAHDRWSPKDAERFPPPPGWEPPAPTVGTEEAKSDQAVAVAVPTVPTVPTEKRKECTRTPAEAAEDAAAEWEERAAIIEFDGGFSRQDAERLATSEGVRSGAAASRIL